MEFIKLRNVEKVYPTGVTAIYGLNLDIKKGDFAFIIGASGSGKSTLIKMLYREEKATNGEIIIGGVQVGRLKNRKVYKLRRKLGIVFQDFKLLPRLTAYENELSGGEQQRVAIARAIVNAPKLLICDEPTGNLDKKTSLEIMKVLEVINNLGTTVIVVTHDSDIVNKMKKRVILIDQGRVKKDFEKGTYDKNDFTKDEDVQKAFVKNEDGE